MRPKLYGFLGDTGYMLSPGFVLYLNQLAKECDLELMLIPDSGRNTSLLCDDALAQPDDRLLLGVGYSLGGNGLAWWQQALRIRCQAIERLFIRQIGLIVGFDPTKNGPHLSYYPIEKHVKRCLCFRQTSWIYPSSWMFGHAFYVSAPDGPPIEITDVKEDHWWVQGDHKLQAICTDAVRRAIAEHEAVT